MTVKNKLLLYFIIFKDVLFEPCVTEDEPAGFPVCDGSRLRGHSVGRPIADGNR